MGRAMLAVRIPARGRVGPGQVALMSAGRFRPMANPDMAQGHQRSSGPDVGLVLSGNVIIGHQVANLFLSARGWHMLVADRDRHAYASISQTRLHAAVADIDACDLGGLAFLIYARRQWPSIITYAITSNENNYIKQLACDMAGCDGFFHLHPGKPMLDMRSGMAFQLTGEIPAGAATTRLAEEP